MSAEVIALRDALRWAFRAMVCLFVTVITAVFLGPVTPFGLALLLVALAAMITATVKIHRVGLRRVR